MNGNEGLIPRIGADVKIVQPSEVVSINLVIKGTNEANLQKSRDQFWRSTCPCGKTDTYPLNGLPEVDTLHSCGNPNHWVVRYINTHQED